MIRTPEELTLAIRSAVNRRAVVASHLTLAITITLHTVFWPSVEPFERYLALGISGVLIAMIFLRFFDLASINNRPLAYIIAYQILTFIGLSFLSEPATPYVLVAIITAVISNVYYGKKGVYVTAAVFGAATVTKFFFLSSIRTLNIENTLDIFAAFFVFAAVSSFIVHIQAVYDWDRLRLQDIIKEARIGQQRLRTLINNITESVLVFDEGGEVRLYNSAALNIFNSNTSLELKKLEDFAQLEDTKGNPVAFEDLIPRNTSATTVRDDIVVRYNDNDQAVVSISMSPLHASYGDSSGYNGYILTVRDITKQKSLEDERNEFVSVISHELRTPLTVAEAGVSNAMIMNKNTVKDEKLDTTLNSAHKQIVQLSGIMNDLSTFAETENDSLELIKSTFSPAVTVAELAEKFSDDAKAKKLRIKTSVSDGLPKEVLSNKNYVYEILSNLLSNAIKYSEEGTVTLSAISKDDGKIEFTVADEGLGISQTDQQHVFDKFYRSEDFRTRASGGTGLGLYISKKLASILQSSLEFESELGSGSTFKLIVVPLEPDKKKSK